ncbi:hypothetical protein A3B36_02260 [Candidatus Uhrbacteria bacterium RIFCSPLOWO2_01_FULL_55_36]|uniref:Uncharacterized protein n=1 Tax=Candidatus Uhrbacteria bacterium RIFCSPLOWO2_01_FULL_55_36 TaxID=1802404 RepID=A0A1F7V1K6_9BACT|nr:MAG: hypothetical protein A3B36_02260 [Candidatus Uhrbacteria bacterium RIFCSPLOWO2_01_FULL_55_36]
MASLRFTASFERDYRRLTRELQVRLDKSLRLLLENSFRPFLLVKKMEGFRDVWEARFSQATASHL